MKTHPLKEPSGTILEITRMSTEDGPGLRTTVFFKGCSLACLWCHNPESILFKPQVQWLGVGCLGCGICVRTCPENALALTDDGIVINRDRCTGCGLCAEKCPSTAMELLGRKWQVRDLADELARDRAYFEQSGGGVTLSGGEVALQMDFSLALLKELRARGISTALDTCGQAPQAVFADLLPYVDLLLFDLKEIDPVKHKQFTGSGNEQILANAVYAAKFKSDHIYPQAIWVRTPVIPGMTDTADNIRGLGGFIRDHLAGAVSRWELCAFNNLCRDKYKRLGLVWPLADLALPEKKQMEALSEIARSVVAPDIVSWSGSTKLIKDENQRPDNKAKNILKPGCR